MSDLINEFRNVENGLSIPDVEVNTPTPVPLPITQEPTQPVGGVTELSEVALPQQQLPALSPNQVMAGVEQDNADFTQGVQQQVQELEQQNNQFIEEGRKLPVAPPAFPTFNHGQTQSVELRDYTVGQAVERAVQRSGNPLTPPVSGGLNRQPVAVRPLATGNPFIDALNLAEYNTQTATGGVGLLSRAGQDSVAFDPQSWQWGSSGSGVLSPVFWAFNTLYGMVTGAAKDVGATVASASSALGAFVNTSGDTNARMDAAYDSYMEVQDVNNPLWAQAVREGRYADAANPLHLSLFDNILGRDLSFSQDSASDAYNNDVYVRLPGTQGGYISPRGVNPFNESINLAVDPLLREAIDTGVITDNYANNLKATIAFGLDFAFDPDGIITDAARNSLRRGMVTGSNATQRSAVLFDVLTQERSLPTPSLPRSLRRDTGNPLDGATRAVTGDVASTPAPATVSADPTAEVFVPEIEQPINFAPPDRVLVTPLSADEAVRQQEMTERVMRRVEMETFGSIELPSSGGVIPVPERLPEGTPRALIPYVSKREFPSSDILAGSRQLPTQNLYPLTEQMRYEGGVPVNTLPSNNDVILLPPVERQPRGTVEQGNAFVAQRQTEAGVTQLPIEGVNLEDVDTSERPGINSIADVNIKNMLGVVAREDYLAEAERRVRKVMEERAKLKWTQVPGKDRQYLLPPPKPQLFEADTVPPPPAGVVFGDTPVLSKRAARRQRAASRGTPKQEAPAPRIPQRQPTQPKVKRNSYTPRVTVQATREVAASLLSETLSEDLLNLTTASRSLSFTPPKKGALAPRTQGILEFSQDRSAVVFDTQPLISRLYPDNDWAMTMGRDLRAAYSSESSMVLYKSDVHLMDFAQVTDTPVGVVDVGAGVKLLTTDDGVVYVPERYVPSSEQFFRMFDNTEQVTVEVLPSGALLIDKAVVVSLPKVDVASGGSTERVLALRESATGDLLRTDGQIRLLTPTQSMLKTLVNEHKSATVFVSDMMEVSNRKRNWGHAGIAPELDPRSKPGTPSIKDYLRRNGSTPMRSSVSPAAVEAERVKLETTKDLIGVRKPKETLDSLKSKLEVKDPRAEELKAMYDVLAKSEQPGARLTSTEKALLSKRDKEIELISKRERVSDYEAALLHEERYRESVTPKPEAATESAVLDTPTGTTLPYGLHNSEVVYQKSLTPGVELTMLDKNILKYRKSQIKSISTKRKVGIDEATSIYNAESQAKHDKIMSGNDKWGAFIKDPTPVPTEATKGSSTVPPANVERRGHRGESVRSVSDEEFASSRKEKEMKALAKKNKITLEQAYKLDRLRNSDVDLKREFDALSGNNKDLNKGSVFLGNNLDGLYPPESYYARRKAELRSDDLTPGVMEDVLHGMFGNAKRTFDSVYQRRKPMYDARRREVADALAAEQKQFDDFVAEYKSKKAESEAYDTFEVTAKAVEDDALDVVDNTNPFDVALARLEGDFLEPGVVDVARRIQDNPWDSPVETVLAAQRIVEVDRMRSELKPLPPAKGVSGLLPESRPFNLRTNDPRRLFESNRVGVEVSPTTKIPIRSPGRFFFTDEVLTAPRVRGKFDVPEFRNPFDGSLVKRHNTPNLRKTAAEQRRRMMSNYLNNVRQEKLTRNPFVLEDNVNLFDPRTGEAVPAHTLPASVVDEAVRVEPGIVGKMEDTTDALFFDELDHAASVVKSLDELVSSQLVPKAALDLDTFRRMVYAANATGTDLPASLVPSVGVPRTADDIHRVASLIPRYKNNKRVPLLPPTRQQVAEFLERTGKPHPFASQAVAKPYPLHKGGRVKSITERLAELEPGDSLARVLLDPLASTDITPELLDTLDNLSVSSADSWVNADKASVIESVRESVVGDSRFSVSDVEQQVARSLEDTTDEVERAALIDLVSEHEELIHPKVNTNDISSVDAALSAKYTESVRLIEEGNEQLLYLRGELGKTDELIETLIDSRRGKRGRKPKAYAEQLLGLETVRDDIAGRINEATDRLAVLQREAAAYVDDVHFGATREKLVNAENSKMDTAKTQLDNMYESLEDVEGGCL